MRVSLANVSIMGGKHVDGKWVFGGVGKSLNKCSCVWLQIEAKRLYSKLYRKPF